MSTAPRSSTEWTLDLNSAERELLLAILTHELGEVRVEAHHTHSPVFHDSVVHRAGVIRSLLEKLGG